MKERISQDIKKSMKEKAVLRLSTLRMALAEFQKKEKEKGEPVSDEAGIQIFQTMVRKRKDSVEQYRKAGREELAQKEEQEILILKEYLPEPLTEEQVRDLAIKTISELGVKGPKEMGKVMGSLTKQLSGKADGGTISRIVKEELQKLES
jgi:uncharacterized protein YqeY